jgi:hypothetical protein
MCLLGDSAIADRARRTSALADAPIYYTFVSERGFERAKMWCSDDRFEKREARRRRRARLTSGRCGVISWNDCQRHAPTSALSTTPEQGKKQK